MLDRARGNRYRKFHRWNRSLPNPSQAAATGTYSAKATVTSTAPETMIGPLNASVGSEASGFSGSLNFESELDARLELRTRLYPDPAQSVTYPVNATLEFSNFNLFDDGVPLVVTGAVFNENKSNDDFDFWPEFILPTVSVADNTLTIETGYQTARMAGDQPDLYFDLETVVVPIPAALPLLGTALAALGFVGWRKRRTGCVWGRFNRRTAALPVRRIRI